MKKTILLIIGLALFTGILLLLAINNASRNSQKPFTSPPTPTPISTTNPSTSSPLSVNSVSPTNGSINVSTQTHITIVFSRPVAKKEITITLTPTIPFSTFTQGNTITLSPNAHLATGSTYYLSLGLINGSLLYQSSFTTEGKGPIANPDQYDIVNQLNTAWTKQFQPDVFLSNNTPYQTATFSVTSVFSATPTQHFAFQVTLINSSSGKKDFLAWIRSLGISDTQLQSLDITYIPQ